MEPQQRWGRGSGHAIMLRRTRPNAIHPGDLMRLRPVRIVLLSLVFLLSIFPIGGNLDAQTPTGGLHGVVTDPSGGVIAKAAVRLTAPSGASLDTTTNRDGSYEFKRLSPRISTLTASATGSA